jgi:eukaryotic-like serine/threonine-protein kinase
MPSKQHNEFLSGLLAFIRTKVFLYNLFAAIVGIILLLWLVSLLLGGYTHHGESLSVPDLRGLAYNQVNDVLSKTTFEYAIIDSMYNPDKRPLTVLDQTPEPDQQVKEGRIIYLTVNSRKAPTVKMPELRDNSLKQATLILQSYGLRLGQTIYKPDLAKDAVLDQLYYNHTIAAGWEIPKGSVIDLVLGDGLGQTTVEVPNLVGLTLNEAKGALQMASLAVGAVLPDNTVMGDTLSAYIYKQSPAFGSTTDSLKAGEPVDIYITKDKNKLPDSLKKQDQNNDNGNE